jgi:hypothetical protein
LSSARSMGDLRIVVAFGQAWRRSGEASTTSREMREELFRCAGPF